MRGSADADAARERREGGGGASEVSTWSRTNATRTVRSDASVVVGARDRVGGGGPTCRAGAPRQPLKSRIAKKEISSASSVDSWSENNVFVELYTNKF
jgi:hypothetical protein